MLFAAAWLILTFLLIPANFAQEAPADATAQPDDDMVVPIPVPTEIASRAKSLTLDECIRLALVNNPDIRLAQFETDIAAERVVEQESIFDLGTGAAAGYSRTRAPATFGDIRLGNSDTLTISPFASGLLKTGTGYQITFDNSVVNTERSLFQDGDTYSAGLEVSASQPLFRGRGQDVVFSGITVAQHNLDIAGHTLRLTVTELIAAIENAYWNVVQTMGSLSVAQRSLELARNQLQRAQSLVNAGVMAPVDLLAAEAGVAALRESILSAQKALEDQLDALLRLIAVPSDPAGWSQWILPVERPEMIEITVDEPAAIAAALAQRPELAALKVRLQTAELSLHLARNAALPALNLTGAAGINGSGDDYGGALDDLTSGERYSGSIGLSFGLPLRNSEALSKVRQAELLVDELKTELASSEASVIQEVREAIRAIRTNAERIEAARVSVHWAERKLQAEERKFELGRSTNLDVLDMQEDLAIAENNAISAMIDYRKAIARYYRAVGASIEAHNLPWPTGGSAGSDG